MACPRCQKLARILRINAASHLQSIDVKAMCDAFGSFEKLPADFKLRIASLAGLE